MDRRATDIAKRIDSINTGIGHAVAWCALALVAVQFLAVVQRYVFGIGWIWIEESIVYFHATLFMAGAAYALLEDDHVRVDVFYRNAGVRARAWVNLCGVVAFLLPLSALIIVKGWPYVWASWAILERSAETSGIPAVYLLKSLIILFAVLVALQGISMALGAAWVLAGGDAGNGTGAATKAATEKDGRPGL